MCGASTIEGGGVIAALAAAYTRRMPSVADGLRRRTAERVQAMPIAERIALALALGDDDLDLFVRASGASAADARRQLRARRAEGRAASVANATRR